MTALKARRVIHPTDVDALHAVADAHEDTFAGIVSTGLEAVRSAVTLGDLEHRIAFLDDVTALYEWDELFTLPERMTKVSGEDAAAELLELMVEASEATGIAEASFTLTNEAAIAWAEQHAADLVLGLRNDTRAAIRAVIVRSLSGGATAQQAARLVRASLGLTPAHANALVSFEAALRAQLTGGPKVTSGSSVVPRVPIKLREADVQRLVDTYSRRLFAHRAETIARTEVQRAAHRGLLLNWQEAADAGMFDQATALRRWVVTPDDRLCDVCRPMAGQTIGFTDNFEATTRGVGRRKRALSVPMTALTPPLHPRCRCTMVLITTGALIPPVDSST